MDKNEIITLSSDDENDITNCPKVPEQSNEMTYKESPEVVDLEDSIEKTNINNSNSLKVGYSSCCENDEYHSKLEVIDIVNVVNKTDTSFKKKTDFNVSRAENIKTLSQNLSPSNAELSLENMTNNALPHSEVIYGEKCPNEEGKEIDIQSNQNLKFFTEFVDFCGSLEKIPNDRSRLTKKLMKKYGEADCKYIKSQEFVKLIQKSKEKINENNLYIIAKEITDELSFRKNIADSEIKRCQKNREELENKETVLSNTSIPSKRRIKFINKVVKKLNKLGKKIRELEEQEVDLSDEEESAYLQLQRYRDRFCQIYSKICKYTNEIPDAGRVYSRNISFTESKYPTINKCIENWLNKTKRFPDFSDIMKLLESQSSSLNLPSSKESIRAIAIEIFQQVGAMLQRRRRYDLWDSCCGFMNDADDPAASDPALDKVLKANFENRIKKENEIFQRYVELQEKEKLEPEEVPDEEANHSPVESGNEDDKEIEEIENSLNTKLNNVFKSIEEKGRIGNMKNDDWYEDKNDSECEKGSHKTLRKEYNLMKVKESKNNYKNCKSLKWRSKNTKPKNNGVSSEDSNAGAENRTKEILKNVSASKEVSKVEEGKCDSDLELIAVENDAKCGILNKTKPLKRGWNVEEEIRRKKKCIVINEKEAEKIDVFEIDEEIENVEIHTNKVFDVQCCQIFTDNVFQNLCEKKKDWGKRKVFKDLTNVKRLIELHGRKKKMFNLFSSSFQETFCEFDKFPWRKDFKASLMLSTLKYQNCALNQEEKSVKTLGSESNRSERNVQDGSDRTEDEEGTFFSNHGNGREDDNNEDENKKNGKADLDKNQHEEEDEEDEEEDEEKKESEKFNADFKPQDEKTEESVDSSTPSENEKVQFSSTQDMPVSKNGKAQTERERVNECEEPQEMEKTSEALKEINKMTLCNETEEIKVSKDTEKADTAEEKWDSSIQNVNMTDPLIKNQKEPCTGGGKGDSETESKTSLNETKSEENSSETWANNNSVEMIQDQREERSTAVKISEKEKSSTNRTSYKDLVNVKTENESKIMSETVKIIQGSQKRNFKNKNKNQATVTHTDSEKANVETIKKGAIELQPSSIRKLLHLDPTGQNLLTKNTPSTSDEERVKRFLLHSPSSISITPPRKLSLTKPPSQAALQALATLRNLKGISATIVRKKPKSEDDVVVIGVSNKRSTTQTSTPAKRNRGDLPVISSVQSIDSTTPKIVTVQGNVSGFDSAWPEAPDGANSQFDSSSIRISNVWGSLPESFMPPDQGNEPVTPGCSSRQPDVRSNKVVKKKTAKKPVEYVLLE